MPADRGKMSSKRNAKDKSNRIQKHAPKAPLAPPQDAAAPVPPVQAEKQPPVAPAVQVEARPSVAPSRELVVRATPGASERERFHRKAKAIEPPLTGEFDTAAENLATNASPV